MKLKDLIEGIPVRSLQGDPEVQVSGISYDSRQAKAGDLFVCIPGTKDDGHKYAKHARERGVVAFLAGREVEAGAHKAVVVVDEPRLEMGKLASRLAGDPSRKMEIIGITGTSGKTTISYLIESISRCQGQECGVIGTISYRWKGKEIPSSNTTPESVDVIGLLDQMLQGGVSRVAMEVSSHALDQKRVAGISFRAGIFTNLTPEHLDYHENMDAYFQAKAKLFTEALAGKWLANKAESEPVSVINLDDPYGAKLFEMAPAKKTGYSLSDKDAAYRGELVERGWNGLKMKLVCPRGKTVLKSSLPGKINAYNILAASAALIELGVPLDKVSEGVQTLQQVPGRMEVIPNEKGFVVLVDYAHKPDALENVVKTVKELGPRRLILVFGCGGDRDRKKRPRMGEIAAQNAELVIVTSDNPRSEDPVRIINEIEAGIFKTGFKKLNKASPEAKGYLIEPDRRTAIETALASAVKGDCVLIAGKGHEDYQILGDKKIHFDDREEVRRIVGVRG